MSKLKLIRLAKALSEDDIADFEKQFGIRMPADLRKHYLSENGGFPDCFKMCYIPKGVDPSAYTHLRGPSSSSEERVYFQ